MTIHYCEIRVDIIAEKCWIINLLVYASSFKSVTQILNAWILGIKSTTNMQPAIKCISINAPEENKECFYINDYDKIYAELQSFLHEDEPP